MRYASDEKNLNPSVTANGMIQDAELVDKSPNKKKESGLSKSSGKDSKGIRHEADAS